MPTDYGNNIRPGFHCLLDKTDQEPEMSPTDRPGDLVGLMSTLAALPAPLHARRSDKEWQQNRPGRQTEGFEEVYVSNKHKKKKKTLSVGNTLHEFFIFYNFCFRAES